MVMVSFKKIPNPKEIYENWITLNGFYHFGYCALAGLTMECMLYVCMRPWYI